jgi:SAM-dependent methyltransferase
MMTIDEAIVTLRQDPQHAALVRDAYLGPDVLDSATRFMTSGEFIQLKKLLGKKLEGGTVVDLGAGTGIASYAFAKSGAAHVWAVEPDTSGEVGRGALARLVSGLPVEIVDAVGEHLPLRDDSADIVYARQVLHHATDLRKVLEECRRVLKRGGTFIACREHVANSPEELRLFLDSHPVHRLAGGEHAFALQEYLSAIRLSGLTLVKVYGPLDSVINTFPEIRTEEERIRYPRVRLERKLGRLGGALASFPGVRGFMWRRLAAHTVPGALHSFVAVKP